MKALADVVAARMRPKSARTAVKQYAAAAAIVVGAGMLLPAAGWITAGVLLFVLAGLAE